MWYQCRNVILIQRRQYSVLSGSTELSKNSFKNMTRIFQASYWTNWAINKENTFTSITNFQCWHQKWYYWRGCCYNRRSYFEHVKNATIILLSKANNSKLFRLLQHHRRAFTTFTTLIRKRFQDPGLSKLTLEAKVSGSNTVERLLHGKHYDYNIIVFKFCLKRLLDQS